MDILVHVIKSIALSDTNVRKCMLLIYRKKRKIDIKENTFFIELLSHSVGR